MPINFQAFGGSPSFNTSVTAPALIGGLQQTDATDIVIGTTTGSSLGGSTTAKTGMHGIKIVAAARVGAIVDNVTGGGSTSPTIPDLAAASTDTSAASLASTRATCASLAEALKSLEAVIHNKGITQ